MFNLIYPYIPMYTLIYLFIKFSTSDNAFLVLWLVHSISVISSYTLVEVCEKVKNVFVTRLRLPGHQVLHKIA